MGTETQDQTAQSEVTTRDTGVAMESTDTVAVEEGTGLVEKTGVSLEEIAGLEEPATGIEKAKDGTPPWYQVRIDEISAKKNVAEGRVRELEAEKLAPSSVPLAPDRDQFETLDKWQEAMGQWQVDTQAYTQAKSNAEATRRIDSERDAANNDRFFTQVNELKGKYPDAESVIANTQYDAAQGPIQDSEHSAKIALYLSLNPNELHRIKTLSSINSINREIGKLEERLNVKGKQKTSAPAPITPVDGSPEAESIDPSKITNDEDWYAWKKQDRMKKLKAKYGG